MEKGNLDCDLNIEHKSPENKYEFDEICYDSDDQDFQHEYEALEFDPVDDSPM